MEINHEVIEAIIGMLVFIVGTLLAIIRRGDKREVDLLRERIDKNEEEFNKHVSECHLK